MGSNEAGMDARDNTITQEGGLLDTRAAAKFLGLSTFQLERWRSQGQGPSVIRMCRRCLYDPADLRHFVDSCRHRVRQRDDQEQQ